MPERPRRHLRPLRDCKRLWRSFFAAVKMHPTWFVLAFVCVFACAVLSSKWVTSPSFSHQYRFVAPTDCLECADKVVSDTLSTSEDRSWFGFWNKPSPGVLFTLTLALITVSGFLVAISKLEQLLGQVTSLRAFLERATEIVQNALEHKDPVWIVCHSPFIGNLSLRGKKPQLAFSAALKAAANQPAVRLRIIGLSPDRLKDYYGKFATDSRYKPADVSEAFKELKELLLTLRGDGTKNTYYCSEEAPTFFLVATEYEAVIASALFVPPDALQQEPASMGVTSSKKVELIGFATRDGSAIESLFEAFEFTLRGTRTLEQPEEVIHAIA